MLDYSNSTVQCNSILMETTVCHKIANITEVMYILSKNFYKICTLTDSFLSGHNVFQFYWRGDVNVDSKLMI